ncbi:CLUMA_CG005405, isoform A [Clunio marinus]|uniref:CLUMA_CG005405, isoform A n=1 Tax=Clunio marinus TaxID=568069 RepID=A0A1J1HUU4_9DIPT|nr:CLUMA_CG005405, isoform A [Clunio marinus]
MNLHSSVVIHVDIDYFYAQVEEVLNPNLKDKPFGVQQGLNMVTCNYIARSFGIKKWRPVKECLEKCPDLVLVKGEDLSEYKKFSKRIAELLHEEFGSTERMGLDEHYMDITKLAEDKLALLTDEELTNIRFAGPFYPNEEAFSKCSCGCENRLMVGSQIAQNIRDKILNELKLTCSVGIAHNKLLAKLVGQMNKPNNQTVLAPIAAAEFMAELKEVRNIFGVGGKTAERIEELGIKSISDLQNCTFEKLRNYFTQETAVRLKEAALGIDNSVVRPSGKPKTVGLEHSCPPITIRSDVEKMFQDLLPQLVEHIENDARIPEGLKVTIRQYNREKKASFKETKQCVLLPSYFKHFDEKIKLSDHAHDLIMKSVMSTFDKIIGKEKFYINLVGLCFNKFRELKRGTSSIESFLKKRKSEGETSDDNDQSPPSKRQKIVNRNSIPANVDQSVWRDLPIELQQELMRSWQSSSTNDNSSDMIKSSTFASESSQGLKLKSNGNLKNVNTLYNHFNKK